MRTFGLRSVVFLAMAGTANSETGDQPKELTLELGGGVKLKWS